MKTVAKPLVQLNQVVISVSVLLSLLLSWNWILWIPLVANLSALLFKRHPIMIIGKNFLNKDLSLYEQEDALDLRFNQTIVVSLLSLTLLAYALNLRIYALGFQVLVLSACIVALLGFCIGCFIRYQWMQFKYRHQS